MRRRLTLAQLTVAVFFSHSFAGLRIIVTILSLTGHLLVAIGDGFKFERTAASCCRGPIVEEVIYLGVDLSVLLSRRVVTLVSVHL